MDMNASTCTSASEPITPLTVEKLRKIKAMFDAHEIPEEDRFPRYCRPYFVYPDPRRGMIVTDAC